MFVLLEKLLEHFFNVDGPHIEGVESLKETSLPKPQELKFMENC